MYAGSQRGGVVQKLRDIVGTKYLTNDYAERIDYIFSRVVGNGEIPADIYMKSALEYMKSGDLQVDIADCRFTRKVFEVLERYMGKITFQDTEDPNRDEYFRIAPQLRNRHSCELPVKPPDAKMFATWAQTLKSDEIYNGHPYDAHPEFIVMLELMRPEVDVVISYKALMNYTKRVFRSALLHCTNSFLYVPGLYDSYWETELNPDGTVTVLNSGNIPLEDFVNEYPCMPAWIGQKVFLPGEASTRVNDGVKQVAVDVDRFLRERPITIDSYFKGARK